MRTSLLRAEAARLQIQKLVTSGETGILHCQSLRGNGTRSNPSNGRYSWGASTQADHALEPQNSMISRDLVGQERAHA
jgi:hypothetical protein